MAAWRACSRARRGSAPNSTASRTSSTSASRPALILYFWDLHNFKNAGWIAALVFAICGGLRLARFNVMLDDPNRPAWAANFFTGMPAPGGAIAVLLPIYVSFIGFPWLSIPTALIFIYTLLIGLLMVSQLPVYSGKKIGMGVAPQMVLPVFVGVVAFFALLLSFPWEVLTVGTLCFLASLPFSWMAFQEYTRKDAEARRLPLHQRLHAPALTANGRLCRPASENPERPARLN